ncbi:scaffold protein CheW associated with MCPs of class 36H [Geotalea daltonii FRC-32]|uniref:Chemotaxis protein CheW n=1 Tax=Geotalea daltonii (strain DSM 22248 / JCM 15807 / FRC-32) TaxID=316067 RepID=B9M713_GEODF|nr:chemotaxis protein CheW [Geotalea daltonii]ACM22034.1 scaffold protein CheW associated with MCPs of class 36H [Geotalea daltonii FRC-32]
MQNEQGSTQSGRGEEYLTFTLGKEEYGMDILKVQEIRGYDAVTHIANSPDFLKGVINLRGVIVPIVDMRIKFNLGSAVYNEFTVVIIINVAGRVVGMVVDGVSDVISLAPEQVKAAPEFSSGLDTRHITGLGTINDQMLILVDIEQLMSSPEMQLMNNGNMQPSALPVDTITAQGEQLCNGSII